MGTQHVYLWGIWTAQQNAVDAEDFKAADIPERPFLSSVAVGTTHMLCITGQRRVVAAGTNSFGQVCAVLLSTFS